MIFNFLKSKPKLKELIPDGFIDIHSHVLPGIDDGAKNIEQSIELIMKMKNLGFSKIIGTPHTYPGLYDNTSDSIKKSYEKLKKKLPENINIDYASEYMLEKSIIEKAQNNKLLCLKANYVLVEMSFISKPIGLYEILFEIKVNGYIPVIAHPERYLFIKSIKEYDKLKKYGCLFQANLLSATDYYGMYVRKNLEKLIDNEIIDFIGSDIHNKQHIKAFENQVSISKIEKLNQIIENNSQFN